MNETAPDPKAVIEALEARIVRLEDALVALMELRKSYSLIAKDDRGLRKRAQLAKITKTFCEIISDERKG